MRIRVALLSLLLGAGAAAAGTLRPSTIVYGLIRDSYGIRLGPDSASVSAFLGTNEVARTTTRPQPNGANYRLDVNVSDPLTAGLNEVMPGAAVTLRVRVGAALQPTIGANTFLALGNGEVVHLNLILGLDTDGDGLPDDWEWMVIANSSGAISNLTQVGPGMDLDGDGMTDDQEFLYGSFPWLPGDELRMSSLTPHPNGRFSFSFTAVPGAAYSVVTAPSLDAASWEICPVSLTETGDLSTSEFTTAGSRMTIYFARDGPTHFYRLRVQ